MNAVDGLIRLVLNPEKQFAVKDFSLTAPDLVIRMTSGSAFVAESDNGVTGLVLRGKGEAHFSPAPVAEQGQLRRFGGKPALITEFDALFVRLNSAEFSARVAEQSLQSATVDPFELPPRRRDLQRPLAARVQPRPSRSCQRALVPRARRRRPGRRIPIAALWLADLRASPGEAEDISLFDRARGRNVSVYASPETLAQRGEFFSEDDDAAYDVEHYDLDLRFEPLRSWVTGRAQVRLRTRDQPLNTLTMKLGEPLTISSVTSPELGTVADAADRPAEQLHHQSAAGGATTDRDRARDRLQRPAAASTARSRGDRRGRHAGAAGTGAGGAGVAGRAGGHRRTAIHVQQSQPVVPAGADQRLRDRGDADHGAVRISARRQRDVGQDGALTGGERFPGKERAAVCPHGRVPGRSAGSISVVRDQPLRAGRPRRGAGREPRGRGDAEAASRQPADRQSRRRHPQVLRRAARRGAVSRLHARRHRRQPARRTQPAVLRGSAPAVADDAVLVDQRSGGVRGLFSFLSRRTKSRINGGARASAGRTTTSNG